MRRRRRGMGMMMGRRMGMRRGGMGIGIFVVIAILLVSFLRSPDGNEGEAVTLPTATVVRVIDGDTLELSDGERVRLIGVDAPEIGQIGAAEATRFVSDTVMGRVVWLESDGEDRDRFGRLRRYVWLRNPTDVRDERQIRAYQLNALLLSHGFAGIMIVGDVRNEALFRHIVNERR